MNQSLVVSMNLHNIIIFNIHLCILYDQVNITKHSV